MSAKCQVERKARYRGLSQCAVLEVLLANAERRALAGMAAEAGREQLDGIAL